MGGVEFFVGGTEAPTTKCTFETVLFFLLGTSESPFFDIACHVIDAEEALVAFEGRTR